MNSTLLKSLLVIYENKRNKKLEEAEMKKEKLYKENPRFAEIDDKISSLSIQASKNLINSHNFEYLDNLRKQIELLKNGDLQKTKQIDEMKETISKHSKKHKNIRKDLIEIKKNLIKIKTELRLIQLQDEYFI